VPYDLDTDFAARFPFELRPVPRLRSVGADEFRRMTRGPAVPVIVEDATAGWTAPQAWRDPARLVELVGADTEVYCRTVRDPASPYQEDYEALRFGQLVHEVFVDGRSDHYLTQGLVFPPTGFLRRMVRGTFPAHLQALAADCGVPSFIPPTALVEGVLWLGVGGQVTPLHFDDSDNLNVCLQGRKRWLLFPPREVRNMCIDGNEARGSVVSSIEQLTAGGQWRGGDVRFGYVCETGPGETLLVPAGYLHQVYSSTEPSIAVNFWFSEQNDLVGLLRSLRQITIRRVGVNQPVKRLVYGALVAGKYTQLRLQYLLAPSSLPEPEIGLGATGYLNTQGF
jgi:hypothetical protein